jgi:DNA-binding Lrp family transcriptional regulator
VVTAFVQIKTERLRIQQIAEALLEIEEVKEVYSVTGEFDLLVIVRVRRYDDMNDVVPGKIARVAGIAATTTLMAFQCYSRHDLERMWGIGLEGEVAGES